MAKLCDRVSCEETVVKVNHYTQRNDTVVLRSKIDVDLNIKEIMHLIVENHNLIDDYAFHDFARRIQFIDHERTGRKYFAKETEDDENEEEWF